MSSMILEENEEPSAEDLLIDLEYEMEKIYPCTVPNRVRHLLAKIAFKVHKEKEPRKKHSLRTYLLNTKLSKNYQIGNCNFTTFFKILTRCLVSYYGFCERFESKQGVNF